MDWLARPLAAAGLRVLAVDHHGNNHVDGYHPEGFTYVWDRPRDLAFVLDAYAPTGPVAAAGFSAGGYTAAALAGARLDPAAVRALLDGRVPMPVLPEFPDLLAALREKRDPADIAAAVARAGDDHRDPRVRAVFQVAPALGRALTAAGLAAISVPVRVHWGGADTITPYADDVRPYAEGIPTAESVPAGTGVRHEDFFGSEPSGRAVRARVAADAVAFFTSHLVNDRSVHLPTAIPSSE